MVRGYLQHPGVDFDPGRLYAPVASHEANRIILPIAAAEGLLVEGGDVSNAYLNGKVDIPMVIKEPTDSSGNKERPGHDCLLLKSVYGTKQAGKIWSPLLATTLPDWGFQQSKIDLRVFMNRFGSGIVIVVIVVDDMKFVSNSKPMLEHLKK